MKIEWTAYVLLWGKRKAQISTNKSIASTETYANDGIERLVSEVNVLKHWEDSRLIPPKPATRELIPGHGEGFLVRHKQTDDAS